MSEPDWVEELALQITIGLYASADPAESGSVVKHDTLVRALRAAYARGYRDGMEDSAKYVEGCQLRYRVGHYEALPELRPLAQALRTLARLPVGEAIRALMDKGGGEP